MSRRVFVTSDPHFGHANIIKYCRRVDFLDAWEVSQIEDPEFRPSSESVDRMNKGISDGINKHVGVDDILWVLGDWCFAPKGMRVEMARKYRSYIRCRDVRLVAGNHDDPEIGEVFTHSFNRTVSYIDGRKISILPIVLTTIESRHVTMSHLPLSVWDNSYEGDWMLYGHCHRTAETWLDGIMPQRRSMDIGIDNAKRLFGEYRPFSFEELQDLMSQRIGHHEYRRRLEAGGRPARK